MSDYYSDIAAGYNELHGDEQRRKLARILEVVDFSPDDYVLDVGCGTGVATKDLPCKLMGIDPSPGLLAQCPFEHVQGSGDDLPFEDKTFDKVISLTAFHHIPDKKKALEEMKRVSKGEIIISFLKTGKQAKEIKACFQTSSIIHTIEDKTDYIYVISCLK